MSNQDSKKSVPVYFYYLTISKQKDTNDDSVYDITQISESFSKMLALVVSKDLKERNKNNVASEKVVWLDSYHDLKNGNFNLIFKSAKYNHVRMEIDTQTMEEHGTRKQPQDGDEEKTHLCIRLAKGSCRFLAVHESNHYGISINCIIDYLNTQFERYNEETDDKYHYNLTHEIMPGDDFLSSLKKARTTSVIKLIVSKDAIKDDFMKFAGRTDINDEIEISIKRPKGARKFPENLIKEYYDEMQSDDRIKKITVKGTTSTGNFEAHTDLIRMKHYLTVKTELLTNEVNSIDFFDKAQEFIDEKRQTQ